VGKIKNELHKHKDAYKQVIDACERDNALVVFSVAKFFISILFLPSDDHHIFGLLDVEVDLKHAHYHSEGY
jgi:hypothetical protein